MGNQRSFIPGITPRDTWTAVLVKVTANGVNTAKELNNRSPGNWRESVHRERGGCHNNSYDHKSRTGHWKAQPWILFHSPYNSPSRWVLLLDTLPRWRNWGTVMLATPGGSSGVRTHAPDSLAPMARLSSCYSGHSAWLSIVQGRGLQWSWIPNSLKYPLLWLHLHKIAFRL